MNSTTDVTVLILRFLFGTIFGALLVIVVFGGTLIWLDISIPIKGVLIVGGLFTLIVAISATIWGDKFLVGFIKVFKFLK